VGHPRWTEAKRAAPLRFLPSHIVQVGWSAAKRTGMRLRCGSPMRGTNPGDSGMPLEKRFQDCYIFTSTGLSSLKLSMVSAGNTMSLLPV